MHVARLFLGGDGADWRHFRHAPALLHVALESMEERSEKLTGNRKKGGKLKLEKCCHLNVSNHTFNLQSHIKTAELCFRKVHCIKSYHFKNNKPQRNTHQHQTNSYLSATILCTSNPSGAAPLIRLSMEDKSYWSIMGCLASARAIGGTI